MAKAMILSGIAVDYAATPKCCACFVGPGSSLLVLVNDSSPISPEVCPGGTTIGAAAGYVCRLSGLDELHAHQGP